MRRFLHMWKWSMFKAAWKEFGADYGNLTAAAISFYGFLSVLPVLLLAIAALGFVVGSSRDAFDTVVAAMGQFGPAASLTAIREILQGVVRARGGITIVGLVALVWTSSQIFVVMQQAFNGVWEVKERPGFIRQRAKALIMLVVTGALFALSIGSTAVMTYLSSSSALGRFLPGAGSSVGVIGSVILALIFDIALFTLLYRLMPDARVSWRAALFGGIVTGVAWEAAKQLFRVYLQYFGNYGAVYGSLGGVVVLVFWIYYSSMLLVLGAELVHVADLRRAPKEY